MNKNLISTGAMLAIGTALISGASGFANKFAVTAMKDPILFATLKNSLVAIVFIGIIASNDSFRYTTSRGDTFPAAIFEIKRSKSEICLI